MAGSQSTDLNSLDFKVHHRPRLNRGPEIYYLLDILKQAPEKHLTSVDEIAQISGRDPRTISKHIRELATISEFFSKRSMKVYTIGHTDDNFVIMVENHNGEDNITKIDAGT